MESSPANATSIETIIGHISHEIINWLSPSNNLGTGQWYNLDVNRQISWFDMPIPNPFSFTFLNVSVLYFRVWIVIIKSLVSQWSTTCFQLFIHHYLIINKKLFLLVLVVRGNACLCRSWNTAVFSFFVQLAVWVFGINKSWKVHYILTCFLLLLFHFFTNFLLPKFNLCWIF